MSRDSLTVTTGATDSQFHKVTGTQLPGNKTGLDVAVGGGTMSFSGLSTAGKITHVSLDDTQWKPLPATALANRNNITVQNISDNGAVVLWNYSGSAPATEGFRIEDGQFKSVAITDAITVYGRILSGSGTVCVDEVA